MNHRKAISRLGMFIMLVALTVLSCSGASEFTSLLATQTPTASSTSTPSPTVTPSPTATETLTPSPSPTPLPTGILTEKQPDGSTLFVDYDNNYQMLLPEGWTVIPLSSQDLADIMSGLSEQNPAFKNVAETLKNMDPDVIRGIAVNADAKYVLNGFASNLTITAIKDPVASTMPLDFVTGALEESLKEQGARILSEGTLAARNAHGVEVGSFDIEKATPTSTGANIQVRSKAILFQTSGKLLMVQLSTPQQMGEELMPILQQISDSIELLEP